MVNSLPAPTALPSASVTKELVIVDTLLPSAGNTSGLGVSVNTPAGTPGVTLIVPVASLPAV